MKGEPKLGLAFLATLVLLAANGYVSLQAVRVVTGNDRMLVHTQEVLTALEALQSTVTDAETGQRGFVLTGREPYLIPYQEARASLAARLARLRSLIADNPVQRASLPLLEGKIQAKLAELGETIELRRKGGLAAALPVVESDRGAALMSSIREVVAGMKAEEKRLLTLRVRESERSAVTVQATMWVANLVAIFLLAAFTALAFRRLAEEVRSARILAEHRDRFEREQQRLAEGERLARVQAEEANRSKDEFLATVSHELRNPLNAIAGWTVILRSGPADPLASRHAAEVIERNARALTRIVEDILDVSRIVTGKLHLEPRETELTPVVRAAVEAVRPAAEAKRIEIETDLAPAGPVWGDPDRLQQVVWNLVANAVKFTPKDGKVEVRLHRIGSQVEIVVSDDGPGIPEDLLPHVFDRFRQADSSSTRRHGGLGLGLAIVRHLVELHGGTVAVASGSDGLGTTFTVSLPVRTLGTVASAVPAVEESTATLAATAAESPLRGLRTLVVEDDPDSLEMVCTLLAQRGADVRPAASTAEALAVIERWRPDLLISDLGMPEEDGYTLIRRVRALPAERGGQVPAVALSARTRPEDRIEALSAGFQMHVAKPVAPAELLAVAVTLAGPGRSS
jgi:signal transduction histidine kinase/ActR/RegA family two-component response regulator